MLILAGCFDPDLSATIRCPDGLCPTGLVCGDGNICQRTRMPGVDASVDAPFDADGGIPGDCEDYDLQSMTGSPVATGALGDEDDDFRGCMSGQNGRDAAFAWTAPSDGIFSFTTCGSNYDSVLWLERSCEETSSIACDDDSCPGQGLTEYLEFSFSAGESVIVIVGGFGGETGDYELNIEPVSAN